MDKNARYFASVTLAVIAVVLIAYTWVPARSSLRSEDGQVTNIVSRPNTWFEVEITMVSGAKVSCRTRRGWPLFGPQRCPLEKLEPLLGRPIVVTHDGSHPYEVKSAGLSIMDFSAHRWSQLIGFTLGILLLAAAYWVQRRK